MIIPRAASTVALVRDGATGIEVYLLRRNRALAFAPGATVYPGGAVDDGDHDLRWPRLVTGHTDTSASLALGYPPGGLGWWIAAVRECFEEVGVLLAVGDSGERAASTDGDRRQLDRCRRSVLRGASGLVDVCVELGLKLDLGSMRYLAHFVTPGRSPRRYDTRFFVAAAPAGAEPVPDNDEVVAGRWVTPADALSRAARGEIELIVPTACTIAAIGRFSSVGQLFVALDGSVHRGVVSMVSESMGLRAWLPGDTPIS